MQKRARGNRFCMGGIAADGKGTAGDKRGRGRQRGARAGHNSRNLQLRLCTPAELRHPSTLHIRD
eukprot:6211741-Pleurochrysis_carterae.AAC.3